MKCPTCCGTGSKFGKDRTGCQRYKCGQCRKIFTDPKPLAGSRTSMDKIALALRMLLEGSSTRAIERITGIEHHTVIEWMLKAGQQCKDFLPYAVYQHPVNDVEVDEQWGFVGCKQKTADREGYGPEVGDAYVYTAIERTTKLVLAFRVGKRDPENAEDFAHQLRIATSGRFQVSTDGFGPYSTAIPDAFRYGIDFGQIVKQYSNPQEAERRRYSPPTIIKVERKIVCGSPDQSRICTSYVERHNLSTRMHVRRMTRLTNAHSKKWENHEAALALWYCYFNFCRVHMTLKTTPAVAAGLATEVWSIERLLAEAAKVERLYVTLN